MSKGLEAITSPVSTELKNGKQFYTYTKEDVETIEKELKALEILKAKLSPLAKSTFFPMTQGEFKLLNEVLNDEH